jgi:hypothetical protein
MYLLKLERLVCVSRYLLVKGSVYKGVVSSTQYNTHNIIVASFSTGLRRNARPDSVGGGGEQGDRSRASKNRN